MRMVCIVLWYNGDDKFLPVTLELVSSAYVKADEYLSHDSVLL